MDRTGPLLIPAALAVVVTARAVGALHTSPTARFVEETSLTRYEDDSWLLRPKDNDYIVAKLEAHEARRRLSPEMVPPDIQAAAELLPDRPELGELGAYKRSLRSHHHSEQSLWMSGRYRQAMTNVAEVQYISYIQVGNQTLTGIIDTGSFELMIFGKACKECGEAGRYDANASAAHRSGKLVQGSSYGSGDVWSQDAYDMVAIGPYESRNQSFWEVTKAKMPVLVNSAFQAIIGVGPPETPLMDAMDLLSKHQKNATKYQESGLPVPDDLAQTIARTRILYDSFKTKTTMLDTFSTPMFSVCVGREPKSDGYFIWNDTAPLVKPEYFRRLPVIGDHTWSIQLNSPMFVYPPGAPKLNLLTDETLGCESGCAALLDSGTSLLAIPTPVVTKIIQIMQSRNFDCNHVGNLPSIHMRLGGHNFTLPPDVYVAQVRSKVPSYLQGMVHVREITVNRQPGTELRCDMTVMESTAQTPAGPLWILGLPFFRNYYTTFEIGRGSKGSRAVHLAKPTSSCTPAAPAENVTANDHFAALTPLSLLHRRTIDPAKLHTSRFMGSNFVYL